MLRVRCAVAALSCVPVVMVAGCSSTSTATLRAGDVQDQIARGLAEQVGGEFTVSCPSAVPALAGTTFTCSVTDAADGRTMMVTVTEVDDAGGFDWQVQAPGAPATPAASPS